MNAPERCGTCRFFVKDEDEDEALDAGRCRRNPPQALYVGDDRTLLDIRSVFPEVNERQWCGEFSAREASS